MLPLRTEVHRLSLPPFYVGKAGNTRIAFPVRQDNVQPDKTVSESDSTTPGPVLNGKRNRESNVDVRLPAAPLPKSSSVSSQRQFVDTLMRKPQQSSDYHHSKYTSVSWVFLMCTLITSIVCVFTAIFFVVYMCDNILTFCLQNSLTFVVMLSTS